MAINRTEKNVFCKHKLSNTGITKKNIISETHENRRREMEIKRKIEMAECNFNRMKEILTCKQH